MNHGIYRLVYNASRGLWMVVSEHVRSHQSGTISSARTAKRLHARNKRQNGSREYSTMTLLLLGVALSGQYTVVFAQDPIIPVNTIPTGLQVTNGNIIIHAPVVNPANSAGQALNIDQSSLKGIIQGTNFSIGAASAVNFNHTGGSGSATLVRINGEKSIIAGALNSPNGKIYLINPDGILFANGARVNTNGLVASALNMGDSDFLSDLGDFNAYNDGKRASYVWSGTEDQYKVALVQVEPDAEIKAKLGSDVMLFAPTVINQGSIETTEGQVAMAAGEKVYISVAPELKDSTVSGYGYVYSKDSPYRSLAGVLVEVDSHNVGTAQEIDGQVINDTMGRILAQRGNVTLAGFMVNQSGRITATSSVSQKGSIRLLARDTIGILDRNTKGITEPTLAQVNGVLPNGTNQLEYDALTTQGTTQSDIIVGTRTGQLTLGENSITTVLAEDSAALSKAKEIFSAPNVAGEPLTKAGEKSYVQKVLDAVNVTSGTVTDDQIFSAPTIEAIGRQVTIGDGAKVVVPGGYINISAQKDGSAYNKGNTNVLDPESKLYLGKNTLIDAAGLKNVSVDMERNFVEQLLTQTDLKDDAINKGGFLNRKKVWYDIRNLPDSKVADLAGYLSQVPRSLGEKLSVGGGVKLQSEGDLIQRTGSKIDVSGGSLKYNAGINKETWVVAANGKSYALGDAPVDTLFTGFLGGSNSLARQEGGYTEGKAAGKVEINTVNLALDGDMTGSAIYGEHQRNADNLGGTLAINLLKETHDVNIGNTLALPSDFNQNSSLPNARVDSVEIDAGMLNRSGFETINFARAGIVGGQYQINAELNLAQGTHLNFIDGAGGEINKNITIRGGTVKMNNVDIADNVKIDVSGNWVNDSVTASRERVLTNGGYVSLSLNSIGKNTEIDVSGGGWLKNDKTLVKGNAGSINLSNIDQSLISNMQLKGYALGKGGSLTLSAEYLTLGDQGFGDAGELQLGSDFFQTGGFTHYQLTGKNSVVVKSDADITVKAKNYVLNQDYTVKSSGGHVYDFASTQFLPDYLRSSTTLTLATDHDGINIGLSGALSGSVIVETGAKLAVDANGNSVVPSVTLSAWKNQLYVDGQLSAPGGSINLTMNGSTTDLTQDTGYNAAQAIWIGAHAKLLAGGYTRYIPNASGYKKGNVYDGGNINIDAKLGYVVAEQGGQLDVSGTSAILDVSNINKIIPTLVASNAGDIAISAREGMLLDSSFKANADGALGGSLTMTLTRGNSIYNGIYPYPGSEANPNLANPGYKPDQLWYTEISQSGTFLPNGLKLGDSIENAAPGIAKVSADNINTSGFADVAINSEYGVRFIGNVELHSSRSLAIDTRVIEANTDAQVQLKAPHITLSDNDEALRQPQDLTLATPNVGNADLNIAASLIDLNGQVTLSGFDQTNLTSLGDIRLTGGPDKANNFIGALATTGVLTFNARQIYPTTFSTFDITVSGAGGTVNFNKLNATDSYDHVLSAAGALNVKADFINQNGVLLAPFGQISLNATDTLNVNAGSVTSVSADQSLIPFGATQRAGLDYVYNYLSGSEVISALPERGVVLSGPNVNENEGSTVDISGGGDLFAYEWIKGLGGSTDVLANGASQAAFGQGVTNTWAIMPAANQTYASYDTQYWQGSNVKAGDAVYLSGVKGLKDGYYTLMPARYALLPGTMLVSAVSGYQDRAAGLNQALDSGAALVSGHLAAYTDQGYVQTSRTGGFIVRSGTDAYQLAQYNTTTAGEYFKDNTQSQQVNDAGRVSILATNSLLLQGAINSLAKLDGKGAELDIAAPNLLVVDHGQTTGQVSLDGQNYLAIDENTLNQYKVASLLLGGKRTNGMLDVVSGEVRMGENANISGSEVILAATDKVQLDSGAVLKGTGTDAANRNLTIGNVDTGVDGDGALVRVAGGSAAQVTRLNTDNSRGDVVIGAGAVINGDGSILLDASKGYQVSGDVQFANGAALAFSSSHINLGSPDSQAGVTDGLWLTKSQLDGFVNAGSLQLNSQSTVDIYGDLNFGNDAFDLTIQSAGLSGYQNTGKAVTINADTLTLSNNNHSGFANAGALSNGITPSLGNGILNVNANTIVAGDGDVRLAGFDQVNLTANKTFVAKTLTDGTTATSGNLSSDANLTIAAGQTTIAKNVNYTITAGTDTTKSGLLTLQGIQNVQIGALTSGTSQSAKLNLNGERVIVAGSNSQTNQAAANILVKGGQVSITATGAQSTDNVTIENGANINVQGTTYTIQDQTVNLPAGKVALTSANGDVDVQQGAVLDLTATGSGNAGQFVASAVNGAVKLAGIVKAATDGAQGKNATSVIDTKSLDFAQAAQTLKTFSGAQAYRVRQGDIIVGASDKLAANQVNIEVDQGAITVNGVIDASGDKGGSVGLNAKNNVTVNSGAQLLAKGLADKTSTAGTLGDGGEVVLSSATGKVSVAAPDSNGLGGATIDVNGDQAGSIKGSGGQVTFRLSAASIANIDTQSSAAVTGAKQVNVTPVKAYSETSIDQSKLDTIKSDLAGVSSTFSQLIFSQTRDGQSVTIKPEAVVSSSGDLTVSGNLAMGTTANVLTLSAAGNLNVNGNIDGLGSGASLRLVAGADPTSSNVETVMKGQGDVVLKNATYVRTDTGFIHVAAGNNVDLGSSGTSGAAIYSKGLDSTDPQGFTRLSALAKEYYGTSGGKVKVSAGGDVVGSSATASTQNVNNWLTHGVIGSKTNAQARWWAQDVKATSASFSSAKGFTNGIGTLGGGDVEISSGGNLSNLQVASASNGRMGGSVDVNPDIANFSEMGGGDVQISTVGSVTNALLHSGHGSIDVNAGGNLTTSLSLMNSQANLSAAGNIDVTGVSNPTANITNLKSNGFRATFSTYDGTSAIRAMSFAGNTSVSVNAGDILPATLYMASPNGNTDLSNATLYPSSTGNLTLLAEKSANITSVVMSDVDPAKVTKVTTANLKDITSPNLSNYIGSSGHTQGLLFTEDADPVRIYANQDVNFKVASPLITSKKLQVIAGRDVVDANVIIQNNYANDVSIIQAGNDVRYTTPTPEKDGSYLPVNAGMQVAGPGRLHVIAGHDVDLGVSSGIRSIGATNNPYLPELGADLMVQAGAAAAVDYTAMIQAYLNSSSPYSSVYLPQLLELMKKRTGNTGLTSDQALAEFKVLDKPEQAAFINVIYFNELKVGGRNAIDPKSSEYGDYSRAERAILTMFPDFAEPTTTQSLLAKSGSIMDDFAKITNEPLTHTGDLSLFNSQIKSERGGRIELLVPQGMVNAGLEVSGGVAKPDTDLGITSLRGGELLGMVRNDFQVNQSRVFTLGGSDLLLYSALADIDAGKGSKTASSTPPPVIRIVNGQVVFDYSGAVTGSGIAALTATGGKPGTVDLFAPYGEINAGEAGIRSAGNINLGARVIVGADNIVAGGATSGVPAVSSSGLSIAAPASADSSASGQQANQLSDANKQDMGNKLASLPSIISVEVISLGDDSVDSASKPNAKRCDKSDKSRKDCTD